MSQVALVPASFSITKVDNTAQTFKSPVIKDLSGTPIDFTSPAWTSMQAFVQSGLATDQAPAVPVGTTTGNADGTLTVAFQYPATQDGLNGTFPFFIVGMQASVDPDGTQLLAKGNFTQLPFYAVYS